MEVKLKIDSDKMPVDWLKKLLVKYKPTLNWKNLEDDEMIDIIKIAGVEVDGEFR